MMNEENFRKNPEDTEKMAAVSAEPAEEIERTQVMHTAQFERVKPGADPAKNETSFARTISNGLRSTRLKLQVAKEIENDAVEEKKGGEFRNFRRIFNTVFSRVNSFMVERSNVDEALLGGKGDHSELKSVADEAAENADHLKTFGDLEENYTVTKKFAEGGQAVISVAEDRQIGRIVGIKTLRPELLDNPEASNHFIEEARISGQLEHPSIIPVYRLCSDKENNLHMAMKLIKGQTLQHYLTNLIGFYSRKGMNYFDEQRSLKHRLDIFLAVCDGLEYAHSRKIIHCDLKPENIMIGAYHDTYLMDWGIAHAFEEDDGRPLEEKERCDRINGTPRYLSPEAAMGYPCDQRSDIFSMGLILFEIVTLRSAFTGDDANTILHNVARGRMEKVRHRFRAAIDPDLRAIIHKATAMRREDRYQNIRDLSEDLRRFQARMEVSARPDNLPRRIIRWMRRHRTGTMLIAALAAVIWLIVTAYTYYNHLESERRARERGIAVAQTYARAMEAISEMQEISSLLDMSAFDVAKISGLVLHNHAHESDSRITLPYRCSVLKTPPLPKGVQKYGKQGIVDFSSLCFSAPASIPAAEIEEYRRQFRFLSPHFRQLFLQNCLDDDWEEIQNFSTEKMYQLHYGVLWIYVGLKNGMYFSYPASTFYDEQYDPRSRPWYRNAEANTEKTVWSDPYISYALQKTVVVTISKTITDPETGEFYGVAGVDFSLDAIREILSGQKTLNSAYYDKMMVDRDGKVWIDSRNPEQSYVEDPKTGKIQLPYFEDPEAWEKIVKQKTGVLFGGTDGNVIYVHAKIPYSDWYYVVRMDYEKVRDMNKIQREKWLKENQ